MFDLESLISRLVNSEKCEFTTVNDHFEGKHNEDNELYRQTLSLNHLKTSYTIVISFITDILNVIMDIKIHFCHIADIP